MAALMLDSSFKFGDSGSDLSEDDALNLTDMAFGANTVVSFISDTEGKGGKLTVTDGSRTATITLLGQYQASGFTAANGTTGGTVVRYQSALLAASLVAAVAITADAVSEQDTAALAEATAIVVGTEAGEDTLAGGAEGDTVEGSAATGSNSTVVVVVNPEADASAPPESPEAPIDLTAVDLATAEAALLAQAAGPEGTEVVPESDGSTEATPEAAGADTPAGRTVEETQESNPSATSDDTSSAPTAAPSTATPSPTAATGCEPTAVTSTVTGSQPVAQPSTVETPIIDDTAGTDTGNAETAVTAPSETLVTDRVGGTHVSTALDPDMLLDSAAPGEARDEIIVSDVLNEVPVGDVLAAVPVADDLNVVPVADVLDAVPVADAATEVVTEVVAEIPAAADAAVTVTDATSDDVIVAAIAVVAAAKAPSDLVGEDPADIAPVVIAADPVTGAESRETIVPDALTELPKVAAPTEVIIESPADTVTAAGRDVTASAIAAEAAAVDAPAEAVTKIAADAPVEVVTADAPTQVTSEVVADAPPEVTTEVAADPTAEVTAEVAADTTVRSAAAADRTGGASDEVFASAIATDAPAAHAPAEVLTKVVADAAAERTTEIVDDAPRQVTKDTIAEVAAATGSGTEALTDEVIAAAALSETPVTGAEAARANTVEETSAIADPVAEPDVAEPVVTKPAIGALGSEAALETTATERSAVEPVRTDPRAETGAEPAAGSLGGARGEDIFEFALLADSAADATRDGTPGFEDEIDRIDLSAIDANAALEGDQAFTFRGAGPDAVANSITFFQESGDTIVQVDVNGDATADFSVQLKGVHALTATDFVL
jgi:hypothetical protein